MKSKPEVIVRNTRLEDYEDIAQISRLVYHQDTWTREEIKSHLDVFPEGQLVAVNQSSGNVIGMAAGLIVCWDDYHHRDDWEDFTHSGMFTNHDPDAGRTFYAAEVMVHPAMQGKGVATKLYSARKQLMKCLGLLRIRAGSRLRGYYEYRKETSAREYVRRVIQGEFYDPVLSFQLKRGFRVIDVVSGYLPDDPLSQGFAALIEFLNHDVATSTERARAELQYARFQNV